MKTVCGLRTSCEVCLHICNDVWRTANSLRWRHNGRNGVSNHQPYDCLLSPLFGHRSKKTSKLRVTGLCAGTGEFPHKWPVTRKMFPFGDVIMSKVVRRYRLISGADMSYPHLCTVVPRITLGGLWNGDDASAWFTISTLANTGWIIIRRVSVLSPWFSLPLCYLNGKWAGSQMKMQSILCKIYQLFPCPVIYSACQRYQVMTYNPACKLPFCAEHFTLAKRVRTKSTWIYCPKFSLFRNSIIRDILVFGEWRHYGGFYVFLIVLLRLQSIC